MKKSLYFLCMTAFALCALAVVSCSDDDDDDKKYVVEDSIKGDYGTLEADNHLGTGESQEVKAFSALVLATMDRDFVGEVYYEAGVELATDEAMTDAKVYNSKRFTATSNYVVDLDNLTASTTYYYRACLRVGDDVYKASNVRSFTTESVEVVTGNVSELRRYSVTFEGVCNEEDFAGNDYTFGVVYSRAEAIAEPTNENGASSIAASKIKDGEYSVSAFVLPETEYKWRAYAQVNGKFYYGKVKSLTTTAYDVPEGATDLGLSVCWATANVGADKATDAGDYFDWGGVAAKTNYSQETSNTWNLVISDLQKNKIIDDKNNLAPKYDAAVISMRQSNFRMPTINEVKELCDNCQWVWTSGLRKGYTVTGPSGASIFLPAAGYKDGESTSSAGTIGSYWTSTTQANYKYACCLRFDSDSWDWNTDEERYRGCSIRGVIDVE